MENLLWIFNTGIYSKKIRYYYLHWVCFAFQYKEQEREQEDGTTVSNHITEEPSVLVIYLKVND